MKRKTLALLLAILVLLFSRILAVVDVKAEENSWTTLAPMPTPRVNLDAAVVDGKIYAIGGTSNGETSNKNQAYDPTTNTWTVKAAIPTARTSLVTVAVENKIYAIGGYPEGDPGIPTAKNEVYNPVTDTWETKAEMPTARSQMCANTVGDQIYVIGGLVMTRPLYVEDSNKTEAYNPATNTWVTKAEMPYAAVDVSSVVVGDEIYVLSSPIQIYDTLTDSWSLGSYRPIVQSDVDAVTILDEQGRALIYIFGGEGEEPLTYSDLVRIYDPENDVWGVGSSMPTPRSGLAVEVVNNQIYVLGGVTYGEMLGLIISTNERYTPLESGSLLPTTTPEPTFTPEPTSTPTEEPQQPEQDLTTGAVFAVTSIVIFLGLLVYFIKRK